MSYSKEYERGYNSAIDSLNNDQHVTAQSLYDMSYYALDQNDFDKGWQQACKDEGAEMPD